MSEKKSIPSSLEHDPPSASDGQVFSQASEKEKKMGQTTRAPKADQDDEDTNVGTVINGRYRLLACVGKGGMGRVYRAIHVNTHKTLAVKLLNPSLSKDLKLIARFRREAMAASRLNHENCVSVYDFGQDASNNFYIVMEFVEGIGLGTYLKRNKGLTQKEIANIGVQLLSALDSAHGADILHRDIKPQNVMITEIAGNPTVVKMVDFGIAKFVTNSQADQVALTIPGTIFGTPEYMSPEQARGDMLTPLSDIYSVGVVLWHLLLRRSPFKGESVRETLRKVFAGRVETPVATETLQYEQAFLDAVRKGFAKEPENRYQNAIEFLIALRAFSTRAGPIDPFPQEFSLPGFSADGVASATADAMEAYQVDPSLHGPVNTDTSTAMESAQGAIPEDHDTRIVEGPENKPADPDEEKETQGVLELSANDLLNRQEAQHPELTIGGPVREMRSWVLGGLAVVAIIVGALVIMTQILMADGVDAVRSAQEESPMGENRGHVTSNPDQPSENPAVPDQPDVPARVSEAEVERLSQNAQDAFSQGRIDDAVLDYEKLIAVRPNDVNARKALATMLFQKQRYQRALPHLEFLVQKGEGYRKHFEPFLKIAKAKASGDP